MLILFQVYSNISFAKLSIPKTMENLIHRQNETKFPGVIMSNSSKFWWQLNLSFSSVLKMLNISSLRHTTLFCYYNSKFSRFIEPTPLEKCGTIYSNGFSLFRQFWPIDKFIEEN